MLFYAIAAATFKTYNNYPIYLSCNHFTILSFTFSNTTHAIFYTFRL